MCGMMGQRPNRETRHGLPASPICPTLMMETESVEGGAAVSYSLPVLPMALGLVFAATMLLALTTRGLAGGWVLAVLAVPVLLVVILAALGSRDRLRPSEAPSSPDEVLRTRY